MDKKQKKLYRSKEFEIIINSKFDELIDWNSMSNVEILDKFVMTQTLNELVLENSNSNLSKIEEFEGQLELGNKTNIQRAIKTESVCTRRKVLDALIEKINGKWIF